MTKRPLRSAALLFVLVAATPAAADFHVLTSGKVARFVFRGDPTRNGGVVVVGKDPELATLYDPRCPATSSVQVEGYLQSTVRALVVADIGLDCAKWEPTKAGYRYTDKTGTIQAIRYDSKGLRIKIQGEDYTAFPGPIGFLQAQMQIGNEILRARFHNFKANDVGAIITRKPSAPAAAGERLFWSVLHGADKSEAQQQLLLETLEKAVKVSKKDGRSWFLLAMTHLYRFGQRVVRFDQASAEARTEIGAANQAFAVAVSLLWDDVNEMGDSRVPGFAAGSKYIEGLLDGDLAMQAEGLADLARANEVNAFFNVFDYIPILQALPPGDPVFQLAFENFDTYINQPETFFCLTDQPEICANEGFAPKNLQGTLTLFGDLYAKAGNLSQAQYWYGLAGAFPETPTWSFYPILADRTANAAARVALYADADPTNDPPVIGAGAESCAVCHNR